MITMLELSVRYTGSRLDCRWVIPPDAKAVGLTATRGMRGCRMGDNLGTPDGALSVSVYSHAALDSGLEQLRGAWSTDHLF